MTTPNATTLRWQHDWAMPSHLRLGASYVWAHCPRGEASISGARPGLISAGLSGAAGLGVGRMTVAPFSLPIRGTQSGEGRAGQDVAR